MRCDSAPEQLYHPAVELSKLLLKAVAFAGRGGFDGGTCTFWQRLPLFKIS